jgi:hypothetical protein
VRGTVLRGARELELAVSSDWSEVGRVNEKVGREFSLRMDLPRNVMEGKPLVFPAQSIWCRRDAGEEFYSMGFRIVKLEPSTRDVISALIRDFYRDDIDEERPDAEMNPEL